MLINTYDIDGIWLKGNLHTHTSNSLCGHYSLEKVIDIYTSFQMEYDFLAITDHFYLTDIEQFIDDQRIILFNGVEYKKEYYQTLGINISRYYDEKNNNNNHQEIFDEVNKQGGFNIICHPHIYNDEYWPAKKLMNLNGYLGIEIFNNNIKFNSSGRAVASDLWDFLLSKGKKVFGFANDDMHVMSRAGGAFNIVLVKENSRNCILDSIKKGRFYASSGILIKSISIAQQTVLSIEVISLPVEFRFIGIHGKVLEKVYGISASYRCTGEEFYIRVEMKREDGALAWTQPFYIKK